MKSAVSRLTLSTPGPQVSCKVRQRALNSADFDKLILDVETKPAISPRDAVASASSTLVELFGLCHGLNTRLRASGCGTGCRGNQPGDVHRSRISTHSAATAA